MKHTAPHPTCHVARHAPRTSPAFGVMSTLLVGMPRTQMPRDLAPTFRNSTFLDPIFHTQHIIEAAAAAGRQTSCSAEAEGAPAWPGIGTRSGRRSWPGSSGITSATHLKCHTPHTSSHMLALGAASRISSRDKDAYRLMCAGRVFSVSDCQSP